MLDSPSEGSPASTSSATPHRSPRYLRPAVVFDQQAEVLVLQRHGDVGVGGLDQRDLLVSRSPGCCAPQPLASIIRALERLGPATISEPRRSLR